MTDATATSRIDDIAVRFWESFLELTPTTATVYGDDRFDDRLDDPGPAGRAAVRALAQRVRYEIAEVPEDGLDIEERITRDMLGVVASLAIDGDDLAIHEVRTLSHIDGAQTLLAQLSVFQAADTPERLDLWLARLHAYDGPHGRHDPDPARRDGVGPDVGPDRGRADDPPARGAARGAGRRVACWSGCRGSPTTRAAPGSPTSFAT